MYKFTNQTMQEIIVILLDKLTERKTISFQVLNPDKFSSKYSGEFVEINNETYIYRNFKSWVDLAEKLFCKVLTPKFIDENLILITLEKLNLENSFHKNLDNSEKYGVDSSFFKINKNEEPEILYSYLQALKNVKVGTKKRVLNLGINSGEEFEAIKEFTNEFDNIEFIGIDYSESAIEFAKKKFEKCKNVTFFLHDINELEQLNLGKFDLIISIGTLQSCNSNFKELFMKIVQNHLELDGSLILGFPNCRWIDGMPIYGAKAPNYSFSEMSILYNDVIFCKKYLQQKKFRVTITGKYYIFLTATSIRK